MTELIEVHWTSGSIDEARRVARHLIQEKLAACAQIIPWVESVYIWNNQLETAQETKVVIKAPSANFDKIKEAIQKNSSYEVPEVTFIKIDGGNPEYFNWAFQSSIMTF